MAINQYFFIMDYIKAAAALKQLIKFTNSHLTESNKIAFDQPNLIVLKTLSDPPSINYLNEFTNDAVKKAVSEAHNCSLFVITDVATMNIKGKKLTYYLYKGYHKMLEKALVFFQPISESTFLPIGNLQFSNIEPNIFFETSAPNYEESSCNALETKNHSKEKPEIAFLIGHTHIKRLTYDIQRLLIDTVNNVSKNPQTNYKFIIQASLFGAKENDGLQNALSNIESDTKKYIEPEYTNAKFQFEIGE